MNKSFSAMRFIARCFFASMFLFAATTPTAAFSAACERPAQLRFSYFPQGELRDNDIVIQPLFKALSDATHMPVVGVSVASYGAVMEGLLSGSVDIARLGPASYTSARKDDESITPFATLATKPDMFDTGPASPSAGLPSFYYSLLVVRQQSGLTIPTLKGKKLALVDPDSTSGALIPLHIFAREIHATLPDYFSRIGYSGNHAQSILSVANKEVDAAFVSSASLGVLIGDGKIKRDELRVLWKSAPIPYDPFVYRGTLCADIRLKIRQVFFDANNPNIAEVLKGLRSEKFVPATDANYQIIRDLQASTASAK